MASSELVLPVEYPVLYAAVLEALPGFVGRGRGWVEFEPNEIVPGALVEMRLRQPELGDIGLVKIKRNSDGCTLSIIGPPSSDGNEALSYSEKLEPATAGRMSSLREKFGQNPPDTIRAMVGFGLVDNEKITHIPPEGDYLLWRWQIDDNATPLRDKILAANNKIKEWQKNLDDKRSEHHDNVIAALFNRLIPDDFWPEEKLFSAKCGNVPSVIETLKRLVVKHYPPGDERFALYSGYTIENDTMPAICRVFAQSHGAGIVAICRLVFSAFPVNGNAYSVDCYQNTALKLIVDLRGLFEDLYKELQGGLSPSLDLPSNWQTQVNPPQQVIKASEVLGRVDPTTGQLRNALAQRRQKFTLYLPYAALRDALHRQLTSLVSVQKVSVEPTTLKVGVIYRLRRTDGFGRIIGWVKLFVGDSETVTLRLVDCTPDQWTKTVIFDLVVQNLRLEGVWRTEMAAPSRRPGRPRNAEDDWAWSEVWEQGRDRRDVFPEWLAKIGPRANILADQRESFNKAVNQTRRKESGTTRKN